MPADRTPAKTDAERLERFQAAQSRYNGSVKGRARRKRYREGLARAYRAAAPPVEKDSLERLAEMVK